MIPSDWTVKQDSLDEEPYIISPTISQRGDHRIEIYLPEGDMDALYEYAEEITHRLNAYDALQTELRNLRVKNEWLETEVAALRDAARTAKEYLSLCMTEEADAALDIAYETDLGRKVLDELRQKDERIAKMQAVVDAAREILPYLPSGETVLQKTKIPHIETARRLREALTTLEGGTGDE